MLRCAYYCFFRFVHYHRFWGFFISLGNQDVHWTHISLMNVTFMSYILTDSNMKHKNRFLGKVRIIIKRYHIKKNTPTSCKLSEGSLLQKISSLHNFALLNKVQIRADYRTSYHKTCYSNMLHAYVLVTFKSPQAFEEYIPIILPHSADYFRFSLSLFLSFYWDYPKKGSIVCFYIMKQQYI